MFGEGMGDPKMCGKDAAPMCGGRMETPKCGEGDPICGEGMEAQYVG